MLPHQIKVGVTYRGKRKGTIDRKVISINRDATPETVRYARTGGSNQGSSSWDRLYLFAAWAAGPVEENEDAS